MRAQTLSKKIAPDVELSTRSEVVPFSLVLCFFGILLKRLLRSVPFSLKRGEHGKIVPSHQNGCHQIRSLKLQKISRGTSFVLKLVRLA